MSCVCIIPARGGSTRIPRKNIREFSGKPIIAYSIEAAIRSGVFDAVYVSTDDNEIAEISAQFGAEIMWRSADGARDSVGTQEVMKDALLSLEIGKGCRIDYACCLYATAPMVSVDDIRMARDILGDGNTDYVVPVATWLQDPGQFYFGTFEAFATGADLIGPDTAMIKIDPLIECDINTQEDWDRAEKMYQALEETG